MQPLSLPLADWLAHDAFTDELDVVVIGSGYGGSVAALRLAQKGHHVLLLERGSEFLPGEFPNDIGQLPKFMRLQGRRGPIGSLGGLFDWRVGPGVASLVANGLGGGSLINAGVMMEPDPDVFAQSAWPAEIRAGLDPAARSLRRNFVRARRMLRGQSFHDDGAQGAESQLPKAKALRRLAKGLAQSERFAGAAAQSARVTIDLEHCTRCGDCFTGCNVAGAKRTLPTTYLHHAWRRGVQIVTGALVYSLAPADKGWDITVLPTERGGDARRLADAVKLQGRTLHATTVVVAAGTFGSTELLQRSQALAGDTFRLSPALGTRLSGNGDSISVLADCEPTVRGVGRGADPPPAGRAGPMPEVGPTITSLIDLRGRPSLEDRIVIQDGAVPGALARIYQEALATSWVLRHLGSRSRVPRWSTAQEPDPLAASTELAERAQLLLTMGHDGSKGRIVWVPDMDAAAPYWVHPEEERTHARQQEAFDIGEKRLSAVHLHTPLWRMLPPTTAAFVSGPQASSTLLTVHPLGGCPMGDSFETGVVDHLGRVWRSPQRVWDNLLVLDGSILPTSLGCNPLWTITALAERAMAHRPALMTPVPRAANPFTQTARKPAALARSAPITFDVATRERLEKRTLRLRGALRRSLGDFAESDLTVRMRSEDWLSLWTHARHRLTRIDGSLRLVNPDHPERRLEYDIACGHVDLLNHERPWPLVGEPLRAIRCLRVAITWFILRGWRDLAERDPHMSRLKWNWSTLRSIDWLAWQAAEVRHVTYDLRLELKPDACDAALVAAAPTTLRLRGSKHVGYAASWWQIARHGVRRILSWRLPDNDPRKTRPGDLRDSLVHQLTRPTITLAPADSWLAGCSARLWGWLDPRTRARFEFDEQQALARSPFQLFGLADSSAALAAIAAYPAVLARHALQTHVLEFRLPSYSGKPVLDVGATEDVFLRYSRGGPGNDKVIPEEIALMVDRGDSSSDDGTETTSKLQLRLWRYRRPAAEDPQRAVKEGTWCGQPVRRARSVLLMHAFGMSGSAFTLKTTKQSFAEHLYDDGWEVWILDSRMSPRTKASGEPATLDQVGQIDAPAAVDHILAKLNEEWRMSDTDVPLQIFAFGQCLGAAALQMALLTGRMSHPVRVTADHVTATGNLPQMPKLAALVSSQTHLYTVGSRSAQSKTWVPALLRNFAGRTMVPLAVRGPVTSVVEAFADRFFAASPVPHGERCPAEGRRHRDDDDDCATCRRIRFLDAELFRHANLNMETHRALPRLFGDANVRMFAHGARFVDYERFVSEDGFNIYVTDDAVGRYLALPIRFVHGAENRLFDAESASRSAAQFRRVHPHWADEFGLPPTDPAAPPETPNSVCDIVDDYGHLDMLIGEKAMEPQGSSPYARLSSLLTQAWSRADVPERSTTPDEAPNADLLIRFPHAGPWVGPVAAVDGRREIHVAFVVKDSSSEATRGCGLGASALVRNASGQERAVRLQIWEFPVPLPARDGFVPPTTTPMPIGYRVARGAIVLTEEDMAGDLCIRCVSHAPAPGMPMQPLHRALQPFQGRLPVNISVENLPGPDQPPLAEALADDAVMGGAGLPLARLQRESHRTGPVAFDALSAAIAKTINDATAQRREARRPFPKTLSVRRTNASDGSRSRLTVPRHVMVERRLDEPVQIALGCCRYPGLPFDRSRADDVFDALRAEVDKRADAGPDMLFLLGDQIYADATAGLVDPLSALERYPRRHQDAYTTPAFRTLTSRLPIVSVVDDHEFADAYPLAKPLFRAEKDEVRPGYAGMRERSARHCALQALLAYQLMQMPASAWRDGYCTFQRGGVRFFVADTRSFRTRSPGSVTVLTPAARAAFETWLEAGSAGCELHCLVSGSVLAPGLLPGSNPADPGPLDTLQASPPERAWLLDQLVSRVPGRFVLISGDYHVSFAGKVLLDGEVVGATIIAPPFYAPLPYANETPEALWISEPIALPPSAASGAPSGASAARVVTIEADGRMPERGSGFGLLSFCRTGATWTVTLETRLRDFDRGETADLHAWPSIKLETESEELSREAA